VGRRYRLPGYSVPKFVASSSATTAPAATAATAATTASTATATAEAAAASFGFGAGFVDVEGSAAKFPPVHCFDRAVSFGVVRHLDKGKPPRLAAVPIRDDIYAIDTAICFEQGTDVLFGSCETEVSNKNILHLFSF
jgi:hypothetical protein